MNAARLLPLLLLAAPSCALHITPTGATPADTETEKLARLLEGGRVVVLVVDENTYDQLEAEGVSFGQLAHSPQLTPQQEVTEDSIWDEESWESTPWQSTVADAEPRKAETPDAGSGAGTWGAQRAAAAQQVQLEWQPAPQAAPSAPVTATPAPQAAPMPQTVAQPAPQPAPAAQPKRRAMPGFGRSAVEKQRKRETSTVEWTEAPAPTTRPSTARPTGRSFTPATSATGTSKAEMPGASQPTTVATPAPVQAPSATQHQTSPRRTISFGAKGLVKKKDQ